MKRCFLLFIIMPLLLLQAAAVFSQDSAGLMYSDKLFNDYIMLEDSLLLKYEQQTLSKEDLTELRTFRALAADSGREDLLSRVDMLNFIIKTEIETSYLNSNADAALENMKDAERKKRIKNAAVKTGRTVTGISIGAALISGTIYAASTIIASDYYDKYTQTEYADQAAFYLFWWQLLDKVSVISIITTLTTSVTAGILAAVL